MGMDYYLKEYSKLFEEGKKKAFANSSEELFEAYFRCLCDYSQDYIAIFCDTLNQKVFDKRKVLDTMRNFLRSSAHTKLYLVTKDESSYRNYFVQGILNDEEGFNKTYFYNREPFVTPSNNNEIGFILVDNKHLRLIPDLDKSHQAICYIFDEKGCRQYKRIFDRLEKGDKK